jgi:acetyl-CoA C-acetyltransferase
MEKAYLFGGVRTPFGRYGGALAGVRPDNLIAGLLSAYVPKAACTEIGDVIIGCSNQAGEDSRNVARNALLLTDFPVTTPGQTVNRLCASGLQAVVAGMAGIQTGEHSVVVVGGVESMSRAPFVMGKAESPYSRDLQVFDSTLGARFSNPKVLDMHGRHSMPETGDEVAKDLGVSREEADAYAFRSQERYRLAMERGFFADEICPVTLPAAKKTHEPLTIREDEHPRPGTTMADLTRLKPLFSGGVVTAGNASGLNDGAAVLVVGCRKAESVLNMRPMARLLGAAVVGCPPRTMGIGPVGAIQSLLHRFSLQLQDIDVIEINEAFASQVLGCLKLLELAPDDHRVNPNGGAIAIGHPLGASGARLALTTARHLAATGGRYGIVSLCIGMGQGMALLIEKV